ncbi:MarR family transcriptional regulator [Nocardia puris]|uniref:DNA-binding MarR family transcriptional regulator n=1 Tax=Nocardia puris TaxID=208602 RepID=A0A366DH85_9NOCA|nr:MarR family transcriptional regulator [Nocardia puris]MBF6213200.1 MarR family transcriptional regulator [Nocardia puris]MBF6370129.1 MarR family transcriptional regulator [Nocardia puris]MBF6462079.1 MarR family transcriptional regulator [Nocardia puris]RBO89381.1 DNA-binding MarR family transcriptional regulator [Nocardia puris]
MTDLARDERMWARLSALHSRVEQRLGTAVQRGHGLGLSEFRALGFLADAPDGELRMQELADHLGLNQSSVTRLVGRLIDAGLAYRDLCPDDRRGVYTVISDAGRERHRAASSTYRAELSAALDESEDVAGELRRVLS